MLVELGNPSPRNVPADQSGARVTYITIPDEAYTQESKALWPDDIQEALDAAPIAAVKRMIIDGYLAHPSGVKGFPDHEAFVSVIHPGGAWTQHANGDPTWVWSNNEPLAKMLSDYYGVPIGAPNDVEDTHWTRSGMPGVGPAWGAGITALKTNAGNDIQSIIMGGGLLGETGTASSGDSTHLTTNSSVNHTLNDLAGQTVIAWSNGAYGLITANTAAATNTQLTVDRWYNPAAPGGAAITPSATTGYTIISGGPAAWFMGLTANSAAPVATDVTLPSEITTVGGGLIRKICTYAHTAAAANFTLTAVFTGNGSDAYPVTVAKVGVSQSLVSTTRNLFQTLLNATATLAISGDQVTVTDTVSL